MALVIDLYLAGFSPDLFLHPAHPGQLWLRGRELSLPPLSWQLLLLLGESPGLVVSYRAIEARLWPVSQVENQQIGAHARRIIRALAGVCGEAEARSLIETRRGQGLVLRMDPESVQVGERQPAEVAQVPAAATNSRGASACIGSSPQVWGRV